MGNDFVDIEVLFVIGNRSSMFVGIEFENEW